MNRRRKTARKARRPNTDVPRRILAATSQMVNGTVTVALTTMPGGEWLVERMQFTCSPVDAMALGTMLLMAVARGGERITSGQSRAPTL